MPIRTFPDTAQNIFHYMEHVPAFGGEIWYVDGANGIDTNTGETPHEAFATIGAALAAVAAGDAINVRAGTYDENGLDMNLNGLELWGEIGAEIINTNPGTCLTVSGNACRVRGIKVRQAGQIGLNITGAGCVIQHVIAEDCTVSFDINGANTTLEFCRDINATATGYDISTGENLLYLCNSIGTAAGSRGFYLSNAAADYNMLYQCLSAGNDTAGFEVVAGAAYNALSLCRSGAQDGHFVDNGTYTFMDVEEHDSREEHEHTYPTPDGEGVAGDAVTVQSEINDETGANSTKNYFGDVAEIVSVGTMSTDWFLKGINMFATTANDEQRFRLYRVVGNITAGRNGGNAWDEGATVLTFDDASDFAVNDLIWVNSPNYVKTDNAAGEIVLITNIAANVVTIARQTENSGRLGLHWNHTANDAGNEVAYLCYRNENRYHATGFDFSAAGARHFSNIHFLNQRRLHTNDGLICRMINGTDAGNSLCDITISWGE